MFLGVGIIKLYCYSLIKQIHGFILLVLSSIPNPHCSGSSGSVSFTDLDPGQYVLQVTATNSREDRAIERRRLEISSDPSFCTIHLINRGAVVSGDIATVEFAGTGLANSFSCKLDTKPPFACKLSCSFLGGLFCSKVLANPTDQSSCKLFTASCTV